MSRFVQKDLTEPMSAPTATPAPRSWRNHLITLMLAVGGTWLFWGALWLGEGLVGGDVYTYSLPQKQFLAETLQAGEWPLWNPRVGHGYPVLGESQTGALYPLHVVMYGFLDLSTAWNAVLIGHYIAAFLTMTWCGRRLGLSWSGSWLAATVYVYGWFPPRAFLDWAILGGVYLPWAIGAQAAWWETKQPRFLLSLALAVGLPLLGGHYQISFLTWLLLAAYGLWQIWRARTDPARWRSGAALAMAFSLGVGLAAVQLLPTWELRGRSQRAEVGGEHEPSYGHIPPIYLSQLALPWVWYHSDLDLDAAISKLTYLSVPAGTNRVEAHLYVGLLPFWLVLATTLVAWRNRSLDASTGFWLMVALLSVIYATGWLMPVLRGIPGFNFFRGPGRAGLLVTFALALLAGKALQTWQEWAGPRRASLLTTLVLALTVADLWWLPQAVTYAVMVPQPPITRQHQSPLREWASTQTQPVRLYAPGANAPTLLGVSAVPVYMGLGPAEYFDPALTLPPGTTEGFHGYSAARVDWLRSAGVTHILSFEPLEPLGWPVDLVWSGIDPLLNPALARFREPIWLYALHEAPGRVSWNPKAAEASNIGNHGNPADRESEPVEPDPGDISRLPKAGSTDNGVSLDVASAGRSATVVEYRPNRVSIQASSTDGGWLVLRDLDYPGWQVSVDGQPTETVRTDGLYRGVELSPGDHNVIWSYRPASVYWGGCLSGLAALCLMLGALALAKRQA